MYFPFSTMYHGKNGSWLDYTDQITKNKQHYIEKRAKRWQAFMKSLNLLLAYHHYKWADGWQKDPEGI